MQVTSSGVTHIPWIDEINRHLKTAPEMADSMRDEISDTSDIRGWSMDGIVRDMFKGHMTPSSVDSIFMDKKGSMVFLEFKSMGAAEEDDSETEPKAEYKEDVLEQIKLRLQLKAAETAHIHSQYLCHLDPFIGRKTKFVLVTDNPRLNMTGSVGRRVKKSNATGFLEKYETKGPDGHPLFYSRVTTVYVKEFSEYAHRYLVRDPLAWDGE